MVFMKWVIGLSFFLYAMSMLEECCARLAQGQAKQIFQRAADGKYRAVFGGMAAALLLQSSSAVSVLLIALTDSSMLGLPQAAGVLAGANVATTVTAWLVAWLEEGVMPESAAQADKILQIIGIVAAVGVSMALKPGKDKKGDSRRMLGDTMMAFAIMLYGLELMCSTTSMLTGQPYVIKMVDSVMGHPVSSFLAGIFSAAVLQSSSAAIAIIQGIALVHPLTYQMVVPMLIGQNLGTCSTTVLAAAGSRNQGREVARMNLAYNVYGILPVFVFYILCSRLFLGGWMAKNVSAMGIAAVHTLYNLFTAVLVYPLLYRYYKGKP